jgi:hypothetical protein
MTHIIIVFFYVIPNTYIKLKKLIYILIKYIKYKVLIEFTKIKTF